MGAELEKRSQEADAIIADLTAKIEQIKAMGKLPPNIQETILKQENAQLRKQVDALKNELTVLEVRNGKIQVALPKPSKSNQKKSAPKEPEKKAEKPKEQKSEKPNDNKKEKTKTTAGATS